jgi:hypothetical protein
MIAAAAAAQPCPKRSSTLIEDFLLALNLI